MQKNALEDAAARYAADPTPGRRDAVVRAATGYVRSLARSMSVSKGDILSTPADLEQVAYLGLLQALDTYDPARGTPFASYAYGRVRGALVDHLRMTDSMPRTENERCIKAVRAVDDLQQQMGREPTSEEVADHLGVCLEEYHHTRTALLAHLSLGANRTEGPTPTRHYPKTDGDPYGNALSDASIREISEFQDPEAEIAFDEIDQSSMRALLARTIEALPEREQTIVALYYYEDLTLHEIGAFLGTSRQRATQILTRALLQLRSRLASLHD